MTKQTQTIPTILDQYIQKETEQIKKRDVRNEMHKLRISAFREEIQTKVSKTGGSHAAR